MMITLLAALRASDTPVGTAVPSLGAAPSKVEAPAAEGGNLLLPSGAPPRAGKSSIFGAACSQQAASLCSEDWPLVAVHTETRVYKAEVMKQLRSDCDEVRQR